MKKFIKGRWFPLVVGLVIGIIVALVMALFGWRITYAPELENSWDAISAVAAWVSVIATIVGVIASFIAIWFAIQVPQKIADRQDKIALFEKRLACFVMIEQQRELFFLIKDESDIDELKKDVAIIYSIDGLHNFDTINFRIVVDELYRQCAQMSFLFEDINYQEANKLGIEFGNFIAALYSNDKERIKKTKKTYLKTLGQFANKYIEEMSKYLYIRN